MKTRIKKFRVEEELGGAGCDICGRGKLHTVVMRDGEELAACKRCASINTEKTAIALGGDEEETSKAYLGIIKSQAELTIQDIAQMTKNVRLKTISKKTKAKKKTMKKVAKKKTNKKKKR